MDISNYSLFVRRTAILAGLVLAAYLLGSLFGKNLERGNSDWSIDVTAVSKIADGRRAGGARGVVAVTFDLVYFGPRAEVESPSVSLIDEQGQSLKVLDMTRTVKFSADADNVAPPDSAKILNWLRQRSSGKTLLLNGGEKFTMTYLFEDANGSRTLTLRVGDARPINVVR